MAIEGNLGNFPQLMQMSMNALKSEDDDLNPEAKGIKEGFKLRTMLDAATKQLSKVNAPSSKPAQEKTSAEMLQGNIGPIEAQLLAQSQGPGAGAPGVAGPPGGPVPGLPPGLPAGGPSAQAPALPPGAGGGLPPQLAGLLAQNQQTPAGPNPLMAILQQLGALGGGAPGGPPVA